jgi:uncharacterized membrane protein YtjA (UPF0391 family)
VSVQSEWNFWKGEEMPRSAAFLLIGLVGFGTIAVAATGVAKFVFFLFMVMALIFFVLCMWKGEEFHHSGWRQVDQAKRSLYTATKT